MTPIIYHEGGNRSGMSRISEMDIEFCPKCRSRLLYGYCYTCKKSIPKEKRE